MTPLIIACHHGFHDVVGVLLDCGASMSTTDANDWSPMHIASRYGHKHVVQLLLDRYATCDATPRK